MQDRRASYRHGVRIEGKLMSPDITRCVDVVIRNLSETGALVTALESADTLPERVYLWQAYTRTLFECVVQWRSSDRLIGLRFTGECSRVSVRNLIETVVPEAELDAARASAAAAKRSALQVYESGADRAEAT